MKTKSLKFLSVFVAVIIAFSCFSVSALEGQLPIDLSGVINIFAFRMYILNSSYNISTQVNTSDISLYIRDVSYNGKQALHVTVYVPRYDFPYGACMEVDFKLLYGNSTESQYNDLSFTWAWNSVRGFMGSNRPVFRCDRHLAGGSIHQGMAYLTNPVPNFYTEPSSNGTTSARGVDYAFGKSPSGTVTDYYTIAWGIGVPSSGAFDFYIVDFDLDYGSIAAKEIIDNQNSNTNKITANQNANTDKITANQNTNTDLILENQDANRYSITQNQNQNADKITANQNANTDKMLNAGSNVNQPDFAGTNGQLDSTTAQMDAIEGQYKIDQQSTTTELNKGTAFISGSDMNKASIQVKSWIERFGSENPVISSFLVAALCLGLCFWVIGRKAASG